MAKKVIYYKSDNTLELSGLHDTQAAAGVYINDATVVMDIKAPDGTSIVSGVSLNYVAGSDGVYRGNIDSGLSLVPEREYIAEITATSGSLQRYFEVGLYVITDRQ